jgi:hypothetical protein
MRKFGIELSNKMNGVESKILREKFIQGVNLAIKRLIDRTMKDDGDLVVLRNGKIVRVKASELQ